MSTNATRTKGVNHTKQVIPVDVADNNHTVSSAGTSTKVEILADMFAMKSVVERKQDMSDKVSETKAELFLDRLCNNPHF
ncbi:hypothetical protein Tco_1060380 [Tanacetum coccineum]